MGRYQVAIISLFRDSSIGYVNNYISSCERMANNTDHDVHVHMIEGDSESNQLYQYIHSRCANNYGFFAHKSDTGLPNMGSIVHATRFKCLARTMNPILDKVSGLDYDYVLFLDSDLMTPPHLIDSLLFNQVDMVSPLVLAGLSFYDIWGFRYPDGRSVGPSFLPKEPDLLQLGSSGGCILFKAGALDVARLTEDEAIVGFCKQAASKYKLWCDPTIAVFHPSPGGGSSWEESMAMYGSKLSLPSRDIVRRIKFRPEPHVISSALETMSKLSEDRVWTRVIRSRIQNGAIDIRTVLHGLSMQIKPTRYLEIGVRRGHSMSMVASAASECEIFGFDAWIENYGHSDNPGPEFVCREMSNVGHSGQLHLISGMTRDTLKKSLQDQAPFDIITVDGDHTTNGTVFDVDTALPYLGVGGVMVIDDLHDKDVQAAWIQIYDKYGLNYSFSRIDSVGIIINDHGDNGLAGTPTTT